MHSQQIKTRKQLWSRQLQIKVHYKQKSQFHVNSFLISDNRLLLSSSVNRALDHHHNHHDHLQESVLLTHPPFCPIYHLTPSQSENLPSEIRDRGVDVGVVVILGKY